MLLRSGKWLGDLWTCCVSSVVGPPYAVLDLFPPCGPMTGGTPITLKGAGFTTGSISVRFSVGDFFADVPGTFVSSTEIHAVTPNVKVALGELPKSIERHNAMSYEHSFRSTVHNHSETLQRSVFWQVCGEKAAPNKNVLAK